MSCRCYPTLRWIQVARAPSLRPYHKGLCLDHNTNSMHSAHTMCHIPVFLRIHLENDNTKLSFFTGKPNLCGQ